MKVGPVVGALRVDPRLTTLLVHTGQHYDPVMSDQFFSDLGIAEPEVNLGVGSHKHGAQTGEIMKRFEPVCEQYDPDWVVVVGDVNSTLATALVASKLGVKVAHIEAGLRSFDRSMPEEINRILTDALSDLLFVTEQSGMENLEREGVPSEKIHFVGNVMVDSLLQHRARAECSDIRDRMRLVKRGYALVTLHRPATVDCPDVLRGTMKGLETIAREMPVVFPAHPRTKAKLVAMGLESGYHDDSDLRIVEPLGYLDFMRLMTDAAVVLTDSGGIQEETTVLGVPCLTLRPNTERPVTLTEGTNRLVGSTPESIFKAFQEALGGSREGARIPKFWDGHASERIVRVLTAALLNE